MLILYPTLSNMFLPTNFPPDCRSHPGAPHQGDASHLSTGGGGHDRPGGPARSWDPTQSAHQIQRKPHLCK